MSGIWTLVVLGFVLFSLASALADRRRQLERREQRRMAPPRDFAPRETRPRELRPPHPAPAAPMTPAASVPDLVAGPAAASPALAPALPTAGLPEPAPGFAALEGEDLLQSLVLSVVLAPPQAKARRSAGFPGRPPGAEGPGGGAA